MKKIFWLFFIGFIFFVISFFFALFYNVFLEKNIKNKLINQPISDFGFVCSDQTKTFSSRKENADIEIVDCSELNIMRYYEKNKNIRVVYVKKVMPFLFYPAKSFLYCEVKIEENNRFVECKRANEGL